MVRAWDDTFEFALRKHLKLLAADEPLEPGTSLVGQGLDSMEMVSLLIELESGYDITFPESDMNFETFATPERLWSTVAGLRTAAP